MASDALNNNDRSPCLTCPHRDMDKNKCSLLCLRLAAYNSGESWEEKSLPYIAKGNQVTPVKEGNKMEDKSQRSEIGGQPSMEKQTPVIPAEAGIQKKREYHKTTVNNHKSKECLVDGCDRKVAARGFCDTHYKSWQDGRIEHPTDGKFFLIRPQKKIKKIKPAQGKKTPTPVIPAKAGIQVKDAEVGKKLKTADESILKSMADAVTKEVIAEIVAVRAKYPKAGLIIDLDNYLKIKTAVYDTAEKYFVTPEHVVIGLLGEALFRRSEVGDQRSDENKKD